MDLSYLENPEITGVNTLKSRAFYMPFDSNGQNEQILLNGVWDFEYYESIKSIDVNNIAYTKRIDVPSITQLKGYDKPVYVTSQYPFPYNPPYIPKSTPAFCYKREITINKNGGKHYLVFEGVDNVFYVYINKRFVGYGTVAHSTNEFDITDYVVNGVNVLEVVVSKWSVTSYLEDQDKWRMSGIFRDVYILHRPENHIVDYTIKTKILPKNKAEIRITVDRKCKARIENFGYSSEFEIDGETSIIINNAKLWNAETPNLYKITFFDCGEIIEDSFGICESKIEKGIFKINGKAVKLKGVNRHEFNEKNGYVLTIEDIIQDLKIMKNHNINAIRTSHYPDCPAFYKLCDLYGFYVMSEADLECHGCVRIDGAYDTQLHHLLAEDEQYEKCFITRAEKLVERDKNRACIVIWSLGNESGYGKNFEKMSAYIRQRDSRPIHYEGLWYRRNEDIFYTKAVDMVSRMYPETEFCIEYFKNKKEKRPLVLCEYSHSMGNSNGDLKDYWDCIYNEDRFMGAFVWEWNDHGIKINNKYYYGGDFQEEIHDSNCCLDGLVTPDRKVKSGLKEYKNIISPIKVTFNDENFTIKNDYDFITTDNVKAVASYYDDKKLLLTKTLDIKGLLPKQSKDFGYDNVQFVSNFQYLQIDFYTITGSELVGKKHNICSYQKIFKDEIEVNCYKYSDFIKEEYFDYDIVTAGEYKYKICKNTGNIAECSKDGKVVFTDLTVCANRAYIDNDKETQKHWKRFCLERVKPFAELITVTNNEYSVKGNLAYMSLRPHLDYNISYRFFEGGLTVKFKGKRNLPLEDLPRIGLQMNLPEDCENVEYLGYGEYETYVDKHYGAMKKRYSYNVKKTFENYIKPQECGSHYGTDYVTIKGLNSEITATSDKCFSFSALPYSAEELLRATHNFKLRKSDKTVLNLDYKMAGVGSNSCGPKIKDKYKVLDEDIEFTFNIKF